jgi:hypothetical protein
MVETTITEQKQRIEALERGIALYRSMVDGKAGKADFDKMVARVYSLIAECWRT